MTTNQYIRGVKEHDWAPLRGRVWQRNYYEHIIRNEQELNRVRQYIVDNPAQWEWDRDNPSLAATSPETHSTLLDDEMTQYLMVRDQEGQLSGMVAGPRVRPNRASDVSGVVCDDAVGAGLRARPGRLISARSST